MVINFLKIFAKKEVKNLEIERKFLLKDLPESAQKHADYCYYIFQDYYIDPKDGRGKRARKQYNHNKNLFEYIVAEKKFIKKENEHYITFEEHESILKISDRSIEKLRYVFKVENNLKWEVDIYKNIKMISAEIELKNINQKIIIPDFIRENLIIETTGMKEFSNSSLAVKIKRFD